MTKVSPEVIEWILVTEEFLKDDPDWFRGQLWVWAKWMDQPDSAVYEWEQGHQPDRLKLSSGYDEHAVGFYVMPMVRPKPPVV